MQINKKTWKIPIIKFQNNYNVSPLIQSTSSICDFIEHDVFLILCNHICKAPAKRRRKLSFKVKAWTRRESRNHNAVDWHCRTDFASLPLFRKAMSFRRRRILLLSPLVNLLYCSVLFKSVVRKPENKRREKKRKFNLILRASRDLDWYPDTFLVSTQKRIHRQAQDFPSVRLIFFYQIRSNEEGRPRRQQTFQVLRIIFSGIWFILFIFLVFLPKFFKFTFPWTQQRTAKEWSKVKEKD